jgi:hypothetical protein
MLTDAKVRNAKPRPKAYKISDTNRLFLLVAPAGGKLWRWNYTFDGKHKTMAFGAYLGSVIRNLAETLSAWA